MEERDLFEPIQEQPIDEDYSDDLQEISPSKFDPPVYGLPQIDSSDPSKTIENISSNRPVEEIMSTSDQTLSKNDSHQEEESPKSFAVENEDSVVLVQI